MLSECSAEKLASYPAFFESSDKEILKIGKYWQIFLLLIVIIILVVS